MPGSPKSPSLDSTSSSSVYSTTPNAFGVYREYPRRPSDIEIQTEHEVDSNMLLPPTFPPGRSEEPGQAPADPPDSFPAPAFGTVHPEELARLLHPFPNFSAYLVWEWWHRTEKRTFNGLPELTGTEVLKHPDFVLDDILSVDWTSIKGALERGEGAEAFIGDDVHSLIGWKTSTLKASVICCPRLNSSLLLTSILTLILIG